MAQNSTHSERPPGGRPVSIGIIGGTGYTGVELLRILSTHPAAELRCITSRGESGRPVSDLFPSLRGRVDLNFTDPAAGDLDQCEIVFAATPNGVAMEHAKRLLDSGVRLIDLSADFRLRDVAIWEQWYGMKHACPELISEAVYGLPEFHRDQIRSARLVANPGCYPTTIQLGFLPLLEAGLIERDSLIADAASGVSGAGRKAALGTTFSEMGESFKAYAASGHRHLPEIRQGLREVAGGEVSLVFTPHLLPIIRGIHATLYGRLTDPAATNSQLDAIQRLFEQRYRDEPFVDVLPAGSHPDTASVRGSNICRLAVHRPADSDMVVVLSVEDNLVKGAAGQAVQNMNILLGLEETTGLNQLALVP